MSNTTDATPSFNWKDISTEAFREYLYADGSTVRVNTPLKLAVSRSSLGGVAHRIVTVTDYAYYIAPGWLAIRWQVLKGQPHFSF